MKPPAGWKSGDFYITRGWKGLRPDGGDLVEGKERVSGFIRGCWAIDRRVERDDDTMEPKKLWHLTHVPTGYADDRTYKTRRAAVAAAVKLDSLGDWNIRSVKTKKMAKMCAAANAMRGVSL